jgi:hypothetical protein
VLIFLIIGAVVVAITRALLGELLRHGIACTPRKNCRPALLSRGTSESSEWRAAIRARYHQANGTSESKRCRGARACR